jgi:hypothetical protein
MVFPDPARPFSVAWVSQSLYRDDDSRIDELLGDWADLGREIGGTAVRVDGWDDALDKAWEQLVTTSPGAAAWVSDYCAARDSAGHSGLTVVFKDVTRVTGRRGYGAYGVSYPAGLLVSNDDKVAAMHTAVAAVLDRHVSGGNLDVPLFSAVVTRSGSPGVAPAPARRRR